MSVRAVVVQEVSRARLRTVAREIAPSNTAGGRHGGITVNSGLGFVARLADDRQLIWLKAMAITVLVLLAMALEVSL